MTLVTHTRKKQEEAWCCSDLFLFWVVVVAFRILDVQQHAFPVARRCWMKGRTAALEG